ncbi:MAG TPA: ABC transporter ATP-binding protein [Methanolinea sp.]|nr:ABC transporter ATP-binding protein [Methanolinea sp.]
MIICQDLTKVYGMGAVQVKALAGVSVKIRKGEFVGIMGPSGSGKSTLLHMFGLLDRPTSGSILIDGVDVGALDEGARTQFRLRRLGYVFQDYALVPELTAKENVYLPSMARGMAAQECTLVCSEILTLVGLGDRIHHLPGEMSGGEQQRVAIARALVNRPTLLLADEPCANLDSRNSRIILDLFQKLNRDLHQTIVMVSHEEWHMQYFDRIISMKDGLIEKEERRSEDGERHGTPPGAEGE